MVPSKSLLHHDIQKIISYNIFYLFFPICKWKEFKIFQLLEIFKKNVLMHRPSIKKSLAKRLTIYIEKPKFWYLIFETKSGNCQKLSICMSKLHCQFKGFLFFLFLITFLVKTLQHWIANGEFQFFREIAAFISILFFWIWICWDLSRIC